MPKKSGVKNPFINDKGISTTSDKAKSTVAKILTELYTHPQSGIYGTKHRFYEEFYNGNHYIRMGDAIPTTLQENPRGQELARKIEKIRRSKKLPHRSKINVAKGAVEISTGKILQNAPTLSAYPIGDDPKDVGDAKIYDTLLNQLLHDDVRDENSVFGSVLKFANLFSLAWIRPYFSSSYYHVDANGSTPVFDGEIMLEALPSYAVYPDPRARNISEIRYIDHLHYECADYLTYQYPFLKGKLKSEPYEKFDIGSQDALVNTLYVGNGNVSGRIFVIDRYIKPMPWLPQGRILRIVNRRFLVTDKPNPFARFGPLFSLGMIPVTWDNLHGSLYSNPPFADAVPIQKEINLVASMMMMNIRQSSMKKIGIPTGTFLEGEWDNLPGMFQYNPMAQARPIEVGGTPMGSYPLQYLDMLLGFLQDIFGIHEISEGRMPKRGSQMSGSALSLLYQGELTRHIFNINSFHTSLRRLGRMLLYMFRHYYTTTRRVKYFHVNRHFREKAFIGSDLSSRIDVGLQVGSLLDKSPASRQEVAMLLWNNNILQEAQNNNPAAIAVLKAVQFGDIEGLTSSRKRMEEYAQRCLQTIIESEGKKVPPILQIEDPKIVLEVITNFMLTEEYEELDKTIKSAIEQRVSEMKSRLEQQEQAQMQNNAPPKGGVNLPKGPPKNDLANGPNIPPSPGNGMEQEM